jgi:hypothetical protein
MFQGPIFLRPYIGLFYQPSMIDSDDCGAISGMIEHHRISKHSEKPYPSAALSTTNSGHNLNRVWTRTAAVESRRLTAPAATQSFLCTTMNACEQIHQHICGKQCCMRDGESVILVSKTFGFNTKHALRVTMILQVKKYAFSIRKCHSFTVSSLYYFHLRMKLSVKLINTTTISLTGWMILCTDYCSHQDLWLFKSTPCGLLMEE